MSAQEFGGKVWFFPDGDLPPRGDTEPHGHESLVILNPNASDAEVVLTVYYTDRPPVEISVGKVEASRVRCIRTDEPIGDRAYRISFGQYALKITATVPVICQLGRMDVRQPNLAYYTVLGFAG
jgi:hypothetical protein